MSRRDTDRLELVVEPWREGLWPALKRVLSGQPSADAPPACAPDASVTPPSVAGDQSAPEAAVVSARSLRPPTIGADELKLPRAIVCGLEADFSCPADASADDQAAASGGADTAAGRSPRVGFLAAYRVLSTPDAVKRTLEVAVDVSATGFPPSEPGNAYALYAPNAASEVEGVMAAIGAMDTADVEFTYTATGGTKTKPACVPAHLGGRMTLRRALTSCCDIRSVPKKAVLRALAEACQDPVDRDSLLWLSSRQGADDYTAKCRNTGMSLLHVLRRFPSCRLQPGRFLALLHPLQPRYYTICSAPKAGGHVHFVLNVVDNSLPDEAGEVRPGLCSSWLDAACQRLRGDREEVVGRWLRVAEEWPVDALAAKVAGLEIGVGCAGSRIAAHSAFSTT